MQRRRRHRIHAHINPKTSRPIDGQHLRNQCGAGRLWHVTVIDGDTGHLTFGRSQTTVGSGNLFDLLKRYRSNPHWPEPRHRHAPANTLRATADDKVMRDTQDLFFDEVYWQPAERAATLLGVTSPLGVAVVYDSTG